jgi:hypothetical protein
MIVTGSFIVTFPYSSIFILLYPLHLPSLSRYYLSLSMTYFTFPLKVISYIHIYIYIYIHTHIYVCTDTHMYTYTCDIYVCVYVYLYIHIHLGFDWHIRSSPCGVFPCVASCCCSKSSVALWIFGLWILILYLERDFIPYREWTITYCHQ